MGAAAVVLVKKPLRLDADACCVAAVRSSVGVDVHDVMRGVPRGREAVQAEHSVPGDPDVRLGHGRQLPPERVEEVAVQPPRASFEARRLDEMRRPHIRHVHLQPWVLADEDAGGAGVVEMDVRQEHVPNVRELEPTLPKSVLQPVGGRRRPAVEERRAVLRVENVRADYTLGALVAEVERLGNHRPMLLRRSVMTIAAAAATRPAITQASVCPLPAATC